MSVSHIHYTSAGGASSFTSFRIPAVYGTGFFKTEIYYSRANASCQQFFYVISMNFRTFFHDSEAKLFYYMFSVPEAPPAGERSPLVRMPAPNFRMNPNRNA